MRAAVFSDFQMDHPHAGQVLPVVGDVDVVIVAGDLHPFLGRSLMALAGLAKRVPVVYVAGNRDFYNCPGIERTIGDSMDLAAELGVHFLEDRDVVIGGVRFAGCTLWTDYNLFGNVAAAHENVGRALNDHRGLIRWDDGRPFTSDDAAGRHHFSRRFLEETLASSAEPVVVVTHHAPSVQSIAPKHAGSATNAAFASDLEYLMTGPKAPVLWVHGATHHPVDYSVGSTRVISNPRGYPGEVADFRPDLEVEIPTLLLQQPSF